MEAGDTVGHVQRGHRNRDGPGATITETVPSGAGNDRLPIAGLTAPAGVATGSDAYILADNTNASFSSSTIGVGRGCHGDGRGRLQRKFGSNIAAGTGVLVFTPDQRCRTLRATPPRAASRRQPPSGSSEGQGF